MTTARWFAGEGRDAEHEAFLAQLRTRAEHDGLVDVAPRDTRVLISSSGYSDLVVGVRPPGLPATGPAPVLQVGYTDDDGRSYLLGGWETFGVVLDPATHYEAADPVATPADLADSAFEWLAEQLRRSVHRLEFPTLIGPVQMRWQFSDTSEELCRTGAWLRRRRIPDRVCQLR
jgi:hypothetical protein